MWHWAAVFLGVAVVAAIFGFGGDSGSAAGIAQVFFVVFLVVFVITLVRGMMDRRRSAPR